MSWAIRHMNNKGTSCCSSRPSHIQLCIETDRHLSRIFRPVSHMVTIATRPYIMHDTTHHMRGYYHADICKHCHLFRFHILRHKSLHMKILAMPVYTQLLIHTQYIIVWSQVPLASHSPKNGGISHQVPP